MERALLYIFIYLVEAFISYYYFSHVFSLRSNKPVIFTYAVTYIILCAFFFLNIVALNSCLFFFLNFLLACYLYDCSFIAAFFYTVLLNSVMTLAEIVPGFILGNLLSEYTDVAKMPPLTTFLFVASSKLLFFLIVYVIAHYFHKKRNGLHMHGKIINSLTFIYCLSFVLLLLIATVCEENMLTRNSEYMLLIVSGILLVINFYFAWLYDHNLAQQAIITDLKLQTQRSEDAARYNHLVKQQDEDQKILIHDIKNHLRAIYDLNTSGQYDKANDYINGLTNLSALTHVYQPTNCHAFNLLMARYTAMCEEKSICFKLNAKGADLNFLRLEDITAVFCNLMDNALEAAENGKIEMRLADDAEHTQTTISMINTCFTPPAKTVDNRLKTTKKDAKAHGFGTKSIQNIVARYDGTVDVHYKESEKAFHIIILMKHIKPELKTLKKKTKKEASL